MEFKTQVSKVTDDDLIIHGEKLSQLVGKRPFSDVAFLLLVGRLPDKKEAAVFDAMLTSSIDHGMGTASAMASRFVSSTGNDLNAAVAAGLLGLGKYHGGAIEPAMKQFLCMNDGKGSAEEKAAAFVRSALSEKQIIYGFGHKFHKEADPRTVQLLKICKEAGYESSSVELALATEKAIEEQKGKRLVLNADGMMAALLLEMGCSPGAGNGAFYLARLPGLIAQAVEEREREKPVRRVPEEEIVYEGK